MVPRPDIVFIERDRTVRQALALALRSGFSRIPVIGENSDDVWLAIVHQRLEPLFPGRLRYPKDRFSAAELKQLAGNCSGVVTGRMHLAIAALGGGVPVAAITYQDKFAGLFEHFGIASEFLVSPGEVAQGKRFEDMLRGFVDELPALQAAVANKLPGVFALARKNLESIDAS